MGNIGGDMTNEVQISICCITRRHGILTFNGQAVNATNYIQKYMRLCNAYLLTYEFNIHPSSCDIHSFPPFRIFVRTMTEVLTYAGRPRIKFQLLEIYSIRKIPWIGTNQILFNS